VDEGGVEVGSATGFWSDRSVLVTGGCGFIGSHLVEELLELGADVRVLDLYTSNSDLGFLTGVSSPRLDILLGDVADAYFTRSALGGIDTVFHLAALIGIPYSYTAPAHYVRTNVEGTVAVLEGARAEGSRRVVHMSTSETYGSARYSPMDEHHPVVAQSPYAATKAGADQLVNSYWTSFGLPVAVCRAFNTFGPRQSLRAIIPTVVAQALYADEIRVGSSTPVRDMNFVSDTVAGLLAVGSKEGIEGETFNIGSGVGRSVAEMIEVILAVTGVDKPVRIDEERVRPDRSEVTELVCDISKATEILGYRPSVAFEVGIAAVRDYLIAHRPADPAGYHI
jgi:nucleoside-diphosphate-sugar epimerase